MEHKQDNKTIKQQINDWLDCPANRISMSNFLLVIFAAFIFLLIIAFCFGLPFYILKMLSVAPIAGDNRLTHVPFLLAFIFGIMCYGFFRTAVLFAKSLQQVSASRPKGKVEVGATCLLVKLFSITAMSLTVGLTLYCLQMLAASLFSANVVAGINLHLLLAFLLGLVSASIFAVSLDLLRPVIDEDICEPNSSCNLGEEP